MLPLPSLAHTGRTMRRWRAGCWSTTLGGECHSEGTWGEGQGTDCFEARLLCFGGSVQCCAGSCRCVLLVRILPPSCPPILLPHLPTLPPRAQEPGPVPGPPVQQGGRAAGARRAHHRGGHQGVAPGRRRGRRHARHRHRRCILRGRPVGAHAGRGLGPAAHAAVCAGGG